MKKEGMTCPACGELAVNAKLRFQGFDIEGWKCPCGEEYFHPEQAQRILSLNKAVRKEFRVKLGQIRSNLIIRIPAELAKVLEFEKGEDVRIKLDKKGRMLVEACS